MQISRAAFTIDDAGVRDCAPGPDSDRLAQEIDVSVPLACEHTVAEFDGVSVSRGFDRRLNCAIVARTIRSV